MQSLDKVGDRARDQESASWLSHPVLLWAFLLGENCPYEPMTKQVCENRETNAIT